MANECRHIVSWRLNGEQVEQEVSWLLFIKLTGNTYLFVFVLLVPVSPHCHPLTTTSCRKFICHHQRHSLMGGHCHFFFWWVVGSCAFKAHCFLPHPPPATQEWWGYLNANSNGHHSIHPSSSSRTRRMDINWPNYGSRFIEAFIESKLISRNGIGQELDGGWIDGGANGSTKAANISIPARVPNC